MKIDFSCWNNKINTHHVMHNFRHYQRINENFISIFFHFSYPFHSFNTAFPYWIRHFHIYSDILAFISAYWNNIRLHILITMIFFFIFLFHSYPRFFWNIKINWVTIGRFIFSVHFWCHCHSDLWKWMENVRTFWFFHSFLFFNKKNQSGCKCISLMMPFVLQLNFLSGILFSLQRAFCN